MRKLVIAIAMVAALAIGSVVAAGTETFGGLPTVRVVVNGQVLNVPGVIVEGRTMAPVRAVAESLGGTISWDQATYTATIIGPDVAQLKAENENLKAEVVQLKAKLQPAAAPVDVAASSRLNPATIGTTLTISTKTILDEYTAKVTLLEVVRGDAAWQKIQAANMFNDPPKEGTEYVAVRLKYELVSIVGDKALAVHPVQFTAISSAGREYGTLMVVVPPAPSLQTSLYAGASHEGWGVYQVAMDDKAPVLAYGRKFDGSGGIWFKLSK